jgi:hypothetical protein
MVPAMTDLLVVLAIIVLAPLALVIVFGGLGCVIAAMKADAYHARVKRERQLAEWYAARDARPSLARRLGAWYARRK